MVNSYLGVSEITPGEISGHLFLWSNITLVIGKYEQVLVKMGGIYSPRGMDSESLLNTSSVDESLHFISNYWYPQRSTAVNTKISFKPVYFQKRVDALKYNSWHDPTLHINDP